MLPIFLATMNSLEWRMVALHLCRPLASVDGTHLEVRKASMGTAVPPQCLVKAVKRIEEALLLKLSRAKDID